MLRLKRAMERSNINYKRIFLDILDFKYPDKKKNCLHLLQKENLSAIEVLEINQIKIEVRSVNQKYRSYSFRDIQKILEYQRNHNLNDTQLSSYFKISRNTICKWKKMKII